jgi:hypothetical protein
MKVDDHGHCRSQVAGLITFVWPVGRPSRDTDEDDVQCRHSSQQTESCAGVSPLEDRPREGEGAWVSRLSIVSLPMGDAYPN